ncbi:MAG: hypothetical protein AABW79_00925 [Nanoarchaeota archaeon]
MVLGSLFDGIKVPSLSPLPEHIQGGGRCLVDLYAVRLPVSDGALMKSMNGLGYNGILKENVLWATTGNGAVRLHIAREYRRSGRGNLIALVTRKLEDHSDCNIGKYAYLVPEVAGDGYELNEGDRRLGRQMALAQEIALRENGDPEDYMGFVFRVTKNIRL